MEKKFREIEENIMTYEEARAFIDDTAKYGYVLGLDTITELMKWLGNPQDDLKFIHIAGTNGKGSTLAYLSTVLKEAGYRTGRYLSPVMFDDRERIQVNGDYITEEAVARLAEQVRQAGQEMLRDGFAHPTTFETETAMAFLYFREMQCDVVVLECGMGGMTDATNVIKSTLASVFVEIGMDHMGFLGNTVEEIAAVKAGIIKPGSQVVSAAQRPEVEAVLKRVAEEKQAGFHMVERDAIRDVRYVFEDQTFTYREYKGLRPGLTGSWQVDNASLAVETVLVLRELGYDISDEALRKGLTETVWPGRFTVIDREPLFLVDGAHNRDAADRLRETLELYFPEKRKVLIAGVLADKEYDYVMSQLTPLADQVITVMTPDNPRALPAEKLMETVRKYNSKVEAADSLGDAVERAWSYAGKGDMILAFGSLSYLGELTRTVQAKARKKEQES